MGSTHYKALFDTLTAKQRDTLGLVAINITSGHNGRTLGKLNQLGLIEFDDEPIPGWPEARMMVPYVPLPVHIAWCEWCSEHLKNSEVPV